MFSPRTPPWEVINSDFVFTIRKVVQEQVRLQTSLWGPRTRLDAEEIAGRTNAVNLV